MLWTKWLHYIPSLANHKEVNCSAPSTKGTEITGLKWLPIIAQHFLRVACVQCTMDDKSLTDRDSKWKLYLGKQTITVRGWYHTSSEGEYLRNSFSYTFLFTPDLMINTHQNILSFPYYRKLSKQTIHSLPPSLPPSLPLSLPPP